MSDPIQLNSHRSEDRRPVATCPECKGQKWYLPVDGYVDDWQNILGSECSECGFFIDWVKVTK